MRKTFIIQVVGNIAVLDVQTLNKNFKVNISSLDLLVQCENAISSNNDIIYLTDLNKILVL